jgi:mycothiol synthase
VNVRRPTLADLPAALAVAQAAEAEVLGESVWYEQELREDWERADLERDAWFVELDGKLAGYAVVYERHGEELIVDGYVHPDVRGRGVGSELLRLTEELALDEGLAKVHNATLSADARARDLFDSRGYTPIRWFRRMLIELEEAPSVDVPQGIELRRYRHPEEAELVHETIELAFADHWNHRRRPFGEWAKRHIDRADFDPTLWWVALEGDELVGAAVCDWKRNGDWGWISLLGVRPEWRRRGIAQALLRETFAEFFRRGERRVALGVDAQSETGATKLYEQAGMHVRFEVVVYEKTLA